MQYKILFFILNSSCLIWDTNIRKKSQSTIIMPWDLMIIGNFISAARLRLSEHKGSTLTLSSMSRFEHRSSRHTHGRRLRCRGNPSGDSDRDDPRSMHADSDGEGPLRVAGVMPSAQPCGCRRVDRGCPARPRSRHRSSGRCGSCNGHQSSIPDGLALSFRLVGSRSGSRCRASSPVGGATCLSERPSSSGRASLQNSE